MAHTGAYRGTTAVYRNYDLVRCLSARLKKPSSTFSLGQKSRNTHPIVDYALAPGVKFLRDAPVTRPLGIGRTPRGPCRPPVGALTVLSYNSYPATDDDVPIPAVPRSGLTVVENNRRRWPLCKAP